MLDGGLPAWKAAGYPAGERRGEAEPARISRRTLREGHGARLRRGVGGARVQRARRSSTRARPPRFRGEAPEPRAGLASGHMPGAKNLPYDRLVEPTGGCVPPDDIRELFAEGGRRSLARPVDHHLRLGRHGRGAALRACADRQGGRGPLRRLLGGMGLAPRRADRHGAGMSAQDRSRPPSPISRWRRRRRICRRCRPRRRSR